ncbi:MAG TPA: hypothetical protein VGL72_01190 [Bryobacteraceae bacterium]
MKTILNITGFWVAVLLGAWIYTSQDLQQPPGVLVSDDPHQEYIVERIWNRGDAQFTAKARFDLRARVLSTNHYSFDKGADLSPVDFALGWGRMSDSDVLDHLVIRQSNRWYFWRPKWGDPLPIPEKELVSHSANMHMIPADDNVKKTLLDVRAGELVTIAGYLVQVDRPHGWIWRTSLSRTDTGMNACELVWVDRIYITRPGE